MILEDIKSVSAEIDQVVAREDRSRSSGFSVTTAHQELSDLKRVTPEIVERLLQNCATQIIFLTKNMNAAETL